MNPTELKELNQKMGYGQQFDELVDELRKLDPEHWLVSENYKF